MAGLLVAIASGIPMLAVADPIKATYDIGAYSHGGFRGSFLHESTGCLSPSMWKPGRNLYMCNADRDVEPVEIKGSMTGLLDDDNVLTGITGWLSDGTTTYKISDGKIGAFGGDAVWGIKIDTFGWMYMESFSMGAGMPNFFDGNTLIGWGQTLGSYYCSPTSTACDGPRKGIDLYGQRVSVPEPGTLALFGIGLVGLGLARRRRTS